MAKTRTQIQAKYDAAHRTTFSMKLHNENDYDIIKKLSSVPSMQGYIKQLIRQDITGSVPVSVPDSDSVCVFVQGKQDLPTNEDKINVLLSIAEQQNLQSELLKEAQKRYSAPGSSVPVSLSDAAFSMLTEQAEKTGKSVPDLIALIVNTHLLRTYSVPENDNESEEKTMRTYGNEKTNLVLTGKALEFYNKTDPITIIETEKNGTYLYQVLSGSSPMHDGLMTEEKLIRWLEDGYDDYMSCQ